MAGRNNGDIFHHRNCATCQRLGQEYAGATTAHIQLTGKQEISALQHNDQAGAILGPQVAAADRARRAAREAITRHEDEHQR